MLACPTKNPLVWAGADDEIVSLASPDVLESQYGPISVPLTLPDGVHTFTGLGQGQNLTVTLSSLLAKLST